MCESPSLRFKPQPLPPHPSQDCKQLNVKKFPPPLIHLTRLQNSQPYLNATMIFFQSATSFNFHT